MGSRDCDRHEREDHDEVVLPNWGFWDFPLSRAEKLQRLLQIFETEIRAKDEALVELSRENEELLAAASQSKRCESDGGEVEATFSLNRLAGSCCLRGATDHVTAVLSALHMTEDSPWNLAQTEGSEPSSSASSQASTPRSSPKLSKAPVRPQLPGLDLRRVSDAVCMATPRVFSIRTPPSATARVYSLTAACDPSKLATPRVVATPRDKTTPRVASRAWTLVTPRSEQLPPTSMSLPEKITLMKSTAGDCLQRLQEEEKLESCTSHSSPRQSTSASSNGGLTDRMPAKEATAVKSTDVKGTVNTRMNGTPRVFSIRTPPSITPRPCALSARCESSKLRTPCATTTPRDVSRILALVTPRAESFRSKRFPVPERWTKSEESPEQLQELDNTKQEPTASGIFLRPCGEGPQHNLDVGENREMEGNQDDLVTKALERFKFLDDQDELEKTMALEEIAEFDIDHIATASNSESTEIVTATPSVASGSVKDVFDVDQLDYAAAIEALQPHQRDTVLAAVKLLDSAMTPSQRDAVLAALASKEAIRPGNGIVCAPTFADAKAIIPMARKDRVRLLREARQKNLRPWRVRQRQGSATLQQDHTTACVSEVRNNASADEHCTTTSNISGSEPISRVMVADLPTLATDAVDAMERAAERTAERARRRALRSLAAVRGFGHVRHWTVLKTFG